MTVQRYEIRRSAAQPGWVHVSTRHIRVFTINQGRWPQEGQVTLFDVDGGSAAWLVQPPRTPGEVIVSRPGRAQYSVRRAMAPRGTGHWNVYTRETIAMAVFGDMLAARAIVQMDSRVVADVTAQGLGGYTVDCHAGVDPPLVLGVVLAIDHLGH